MQMLNFKMLFARRSQMVPARYLNISGPVLKGFKDALWLLCAYPVQRLILREKPGNNYCVNPGLGIRQGKASHPDTLFFFEEDVKLTRRQRREIIFISFCATAVSRKRTGSENYQIRLAIWISPKYKKTKQHLTCRNLNNTDKSNELFFLHFVAGVEIK